jgi:hypothetical protein
VDDRAGCNRRTSRRSFHGQSSRLGSAQIVTHIYVRPDPAAQLHVSLTAAWELLEWLPKRAKWQEWPARKCFLGWYLPLGEPRPIPEGAIVHRSVIERTAKVPSYQPMNMPTSYTIEEGPTEPAGA